MKKNKNKDARNIGVALILGLIIGLILYFMGKSELTLYVKPIGVVFIRLLKMVIIPLVFSSIYMSMVNLGTPETLGVMGIRAMAYYFITTMVAVLIGIIFVNIISPGVGIGLGTTGLQGLSTEMGSQIQNQEGLFKTIVGVIVDAVPSNPIQSMASGTILQVIVFAILFGIIALYNPSVSEPFTKVTRSVEKMSLALTHLIMKIAPLGIFVLMLDVMAKSGGDAISSLGKYMGTVLVGLLCHAVFLMFLASTRLKKSPLFIFNGLKSALMTAFSTSSSAATLPISMANTEENLGLKKETVEFVLPLGATINMDGTALYESVAAIFIAQAYGIDLSIGQQIIIFLTASLAAVGAAAIPGAGLITMSIVLQAVGLPIEGIGLILAVDRILDMFRTTVNVFGDCVGSIVVDSTLKR